MAEPGADLPDPCAAEAIQRPGAIQPHGCLIVCGMPSWIVCYASANLARYLGRPAAETLGLPIDAIIPPRALHDLRNVLQSSVVSGRPERLAGAELVPGQPPFDLLLHVANGEAVLELFPAVPDRSRADPLALVQSILGRLKRAASLARFLQTATSQIRAMTGFDRVLIYRFLDDGSGEVVAETLRAGLTPFLGLRYPATDIPAQARALYLKQWQRLVPDVDYAPVPLLAKAGRPEDLDLGRAALRSASPVHLAYLKALGSRATLTLSIIIGDRLWGMIACHHEQPHLVSLSTAAAAELFAQIFSLQIESRERAERLDAAAHAVEVLARLREAVSAGPPLAAGVAAHAGMLQEIIASDGLALWSRDGVETIGLVPATAHLDGIRACLDARAPDEVVAIDSLRRVAPGADASGVCGVLAISIPREKPDYLLFFRRETVKTVSWGGDPSKPGTVDAEGRTVGPRQSFDLWRETVEGEAVPWSHRDRLAAGAIRTLLLEDFVRAASP